MQERGGPDFASSDAWPLSRATVRLAWTETPGSSRQARVEGGVDRCQTPAARRRQESGRAGCGRRLGVAPMGIASSASHHHTVVPDSEQTIPHASGSRASSAADQRDSGRPVCAGSSHARAGPCLGNRGGGTDRGPPRPGPLICVVAAPAHENVLAALPRGASAPRPVSSLSSPAPPTRRSSPRLPRIVSSSRPAKSRSSPPKPTMLSSLVPPRTRSAAVPDRSRVMT